MKQHSKSFTGGSKRNQWIQVNFRRPVKVFGIVTQGRSNANEWVTGFNVQYGNSPSSLTTISTGKQPVSNSHVLCYLLYKY